MPTCIYCLTEAPETAFTREHVIPDSFGRFNGALVLHNTVCAACNAYFGNTIDRELARETPEGLERYRSGVKSPQEILKFRYSTLTLRAHAAGEFTGAELQIVPDRAGSDLTTTILPSAAIRKARGEDFLYFTEAQILDGTWSQQDVDWRRGVKLFGPDEPVLRMRNALERQGVQLSNWRPLEPPGPSIPEVLEEFTVPMNVRRAIAKISLNYLTYRLGSDFVLAPAFNTVRRFIRLGDVPPLPPVHVSNDLPFGTGRPSHERPLVHFVGFDSHESHRNLLGVLTLFGYHGYIVMLAENFPGPWPEVPVAHLYNPKTLAVTEMEPRKPRWRHEDEPA